MEGIKLADEVLAARGGSCDTAGLITNVAGAIAGR
jgi:hypothetical protein